MSRILGCAVFLVSIFLSTASLAAQKKEWTLLFFISGDEEAIDAWSRVPIRKLEQLKSDPSRWIVAHTDFYWDVDGKTPIEEPAKRYVIENHPGPIDGFDFSTLLIRSPEVWRSEGETNSAAGESLNEFLAWAMPRYPAKHYALFVLGHSWGWRGVGQDYRPGYELPEPPTDTAVEFTMASLDEMKDALSPHFSAKRPVDLLVLDACNDGVMEVAYEFKDLAKAFLAAPTEMPFMSFDYTRSLSQPWKTGQELARRLVLEALPTFGRGGSQVAQEREYPALAITAVDLENSAAFWKQWKELSRLLPASNFEDLFLGEKAITWLDNSWDVDVAELLKELGSRSNKEKVRAIANRLYDEAYGAHPPAFDEIYLPLQTAGADKIRVILRADELHQPERSIARAKESFDFMNPHLLNVEKTYELFGTLPEIWVRIEFPWSESSLALRPFIPGGTDATVFALQGETVVDTWKMTHVNGVSLRDSYPKTSPYLANGHTFGMGRNHGLTVNLDEVADLTVPAHHHYGAEGWLSGQDFYRSVRFARDFGWDQLLYAPRPRRWVARPAYHNRALRRTLERR